MGASEEPAGAVLATADQAKLAIAGRFAPLLSHESVLRVKCHRKGVLGGNQPVTKRFYVQVNSGSSLHLALFILTRKEYV